MPVTNENKQEYVRMLIEYKMKNSIAQQTQRFLQGFYSIIPHEMIQAFFVAENLGLVISGISIVDVDDLRRHTQYRGYTESSLQVVWFWEIINDMTLEQRTNFLQFVTGSSQAPLQGFANLSGGRFSIREYPGGQLGETAPLPLAHTCFNALDLPVYPTKAILASKLSTAIREGGGEIANA